MKPHLVSILYEDAQDAPGDEPTEEPSCLGDLRLDQIVRALTAGRDEYQLTAFLHRPLRSVETVRYRHHILRDLEREPVRDAVAAFARGMAQVRMHLHLADTLHHERQRQRWFVSAAAVYCSVVPAFAAALRKAEIQSAGLRLLCESLDVYTTSATFDALNVDTHGRETELAEIAYSVHLRGTRVTVSAYDDEPGVSGGGGCRLRQVPTGCRARPPRPLSRLLRHEPRRDADPRSGRAAVPGAVRAARRVPPAA